MSIRYYKLFDLLNRRGLKKSDLRSVISSATIAKLSKGAYISGEAIEKICLFLGCQPGDIMEVVTEDIIDDSMKLVYKDIVLDGHPDAISDTITIGETKPFGIDTHEADEDLLVSRQYLDYPNL